MGTSSEKHSTLGAWLLARLFVHIEAQNLGGRVKGADGTYKLDAANTRVPDVSYMLPASVAKLAPNTVFCPFAPDFAIEIQSPSQRDAEMRQLAQLFIKSGALPVWTIHPEGEVVKVYRPGQPTIERADNDDVEGYGVVRGFKIDLREMFDRVEGL